MPANSPSPPCSTSSNAACSKSSTRRRTRRPPSSKNIRRRIDAASLLFKVRVLGDELRQREAPDTPRTARAVHANQLRGPKDHDHQADCHDSTLVLALAAPAARAGSRAGVGRRARRPLRRALHREPEAPADACRRARRPNARARGRGAGRGRAPGPSGVRPCSPLPAVLDRSEALYDQAREAIDNNQFDQALRELKQLTDQAGGPARISRTGATPRCTGRHTASRSSRSNNEALETIKELSKQFAKSTWVKDAKALAVEIQQAVGQPVSAELQNDEELKLLALRGVMQTDPDKGLPIIEKMLAGGATPRVRDRALFVLAQSRSPRARDIIATRRRTTRTPSCRSAPSATSA